MTGMGNVVSSTSCTSDHCIVSFTVSFDPTAFNTRIARSAYLLTRTAGPRIRLLVFASGVDVDAACHGWCGRGQRYEKIHEQYCENNAYCLGQTPCDLWDDDLR